MNEFGPAAPLAATWNRFWFAPADPRPLAMLRVGAASLGLFLLWSYAADIEAWFGPAGLLPADTVAAWRGGSIASLFALAGTTGAVWLLFLLTAAAFVLLLVGVLPSVTSVATAVLWASLLNRGPMLAGPADDCLAVLLWCIAVGFAVRPGVGLGLVQVHAAVITAAAVLAQLKGDVWWNGTAAWWLAGREGSRVVDLTGLLARSGLAMNAVTHAITAFELLFAVGIWFASMQRTVSRIGLVAWPLVGLFAGEPFWGLAMALFALPGAMDLTLKRGDGPQVCLHGKPRLPAELALAGSAR